MPLQFAAGLALQQVETRKPAQPALERFQYGAAPRRRRNQSSAQEARRAATMRLNLRFAEAASREVARHTRISPEPFASSVSFENPGTHRLEDTRIVLF